jgi:hypothetical protein
MKHYKTKMTSKYAICKECHKEFVRVPRIYMRTCEDCRSNIAKKSRVKALITIKKNRERKNGKSRKTR